MRKDTLLYTGLAVAVGLSACNSKAEPTVPFTPSPLISPPTEVVPGATATEISTAYPSATSTETVIPSETPVPTETFAPMELSVDLNKPTKCTYEDITSGRLAWNERQQAKPFPEGAEASGWYKGPHSGKNIVVLKSPSLYAEQISSVCEVSGDFLGMPSKKFYILGLKILNPDNTFGFLHLFNPSLSGFNDDIKVLKKSNGIGVGLVRSYSPDILQKYYNDPFSGPTSHLYFTYGDNIATQVDLLIRTGVVSGDIEDTLFDDAFSEGFTP